MINIFRGLLLLVSTFLMSSAFATGGFTVDQVCEGAGYTLGNGGYFCTKYCGTEGRDLRRNCNGQKGENEPRGHFCDLIKKIALHINGEGDTELPCEQMMIGNCVNTLSEDGTEITFDTGTSLDDFTGACATIALDGAKFVWGLSITGATVFGYDMASCDFELLGAEAFELCQP